MKSSLTSIMTSFTSKLKSEFKKKREEFRPELFKIQGVAYIIHKKIFQSFPAVVTDMILPCCHIKEENLLSIMYKHP